MNRFGSLTIGVLALMLAVSLHAQGTYTYQDDVRPVLNGSCAFCHDFVADYDDLMAAVSESAPVGIPVVYPGKPDSSMIVWRLEGELPSGDAITRMPQFADPLSDDTIRIVRDWIETGAVNESPVGVEEKTWGGVKAEHR